MKLSGYRQPHFRAVQAKEPPCLQRQHVVELNLEIEAAQSCLVEIMHQVGRRDEYAGVVFYLGQQFVHQGDLPGAAGPLPLSEKAVDLVDEQERMVSLRLLECLGDILL